MLEDFKQNIERKHIVALVLTFVLLVITLIANHFICATVQEPYDEVHSQVSSIQSKVDILASAKTTTDSKTTSTVSEVNADKVTSDTTVITKMFNDVLASPITAKDYMNMRNSLVNDYNLTSTSHFMTDIVPEISGYADGDAYSLKFKDISINLMSISNSYYSYLVTATMTTTTANGSNDAIIVVSCNVDNNSKISLSDGYVCVAQ